MGEDKYYQSKKHSVLKVNKMVANKVCSIYGLWFSNFKTTQLEK